MAVRQFLSAALASGDCLLLAFLLPPPPVRSHGLRFTSSPTVRSGAFDADGRIWAPERLHPVDVLAVLLRR